jgi:hypothetical protein
MLRSVVMRRIALQGDNLMHGQMSKVGMLVIGGLVLLAGCASTNDRWEYRVFGHPPTNGDQARELFNELGRDGWEIFAATDHLVYAKRPVPH